LTAVRRAQYPSSKSRISFGSPAGTAGSPPSVEAPPLQTLVAAPERSQLATNDLDLSQGLPSKFDLGLEHADIPQGN
jgi:hypothetical protein